MAKHEGVITYFNEKKGYGFISCDDKKNIYVHYSAIKGKGYKTLAEGQKVLFELESDSSGFQARNVAKI